MKSKVLSFGAHPDDIEIGCGGTEAGMVLRGFEVTHAILTSGEAGSRNINPIDLAKQREAEARASARILGVHQIEFLRYPDGLTHYTREMKTEIIRLIRRIQPKFIFLHTREDRFPDHKIAHDLIMASIEGASGPWYPEITEEPHSVPNILGYEVWTPIAQPQMFTSISDFVDQKMEALRAHRSQLESIPYDDAVLGLNRYRGAMSRKSAYAEAFEIIRSDGGI